MKQALDDSLSAQAVLQFSLSGEWPDAAVIGSLEAKLRLHRRFLTSCCCTACLLVSHVHEGQQVARQGC